MQELVYTPILPLYTANIQLFFENFPKKAIPFPYMFLKKRRGFVAAPAFMASKGDFFL
ncbi:hypothetical protein I656_00729 [Geobacillus sp. WSUCF1]|nr:hypothetical protein I656_00729 [Geobacillus sp. WSUCF1]